MEDKRKFGIGSVDFSAPSTRFFIAATILIFIIAIYFRTTLLKDFGFYEPDGFYHFSVIRAAVNNNFMIPKVLSISGWPAPTIVSEPFGLYWVTLVPYFFLRFFGISYYTVMRLVPVLFAIFDIIGAYFLSRYLSKDKLFGLLVMVLVALSMGDAARTSALIYRGDGFITIFLIMALIFLVEIFRQESKNKKIAFMLLSAISLSIGSLVWNGAAFAIAIYVMAFALIVSFAFIFGERKKLFDASYLLISTILWYVLANIYRALGWIQDQTFTGKYFLALYALMVIAWFVLYYINENSAKQKQSVSSWARFILILIVAVASGFILYVFTPQFINQVFVGNGFIITSKFAATIQELQPPTAQFIYISFGATVFTTPMSALIMLSTYYPQLVLLFWVILLISFAPYFFMRIENSGKGFLSGDAKIKFGFDEAFLSLVSYMALTAYLQMHAIRFNSLISIPLAIFSAYTLYWIITLFKNKELIKNIAYLLIVIFLIVIIYYDGIYSATVAQADNINPSMISALQWLKGSAPTNSVVLTLWPDGSVVEGVANLTSVTDSVGSQNATKGDTFAAWLLNTTPDPQFLLSSINGKPNYLYARYTWMNELGGIYTESNLSTNESGLYGLLRLGLIKEASNSTVQEFEFGGIGTTQPLGAMLTVRQINNTNYISSYMLDGNQYIPFEYVELYNQDNSSFSIIPQQVKSNATVAKGLFLVTYSNIPNKKLSVNITGAYFMAPALAGSNMVRFLYMCDKTTCYWNTNNTVAQMQLIYVNGDSKIFKINYNSTS